MERMKVAYFGECDNLTAGILERRNCDKTRIKIFSMGLVYTKKKDNEQREKTVQAEEFIDRMISMKQKTIETFNDPPRTEIKK